MTSGIISRIIERQEAYDKDPEAYERKEKQLEEEKEREAQEERDYYERTENE